MRILSIFVLITLLFAACSTKKPDDAWRYNAVNAYKHAQTYFLEGKSSLAKNDFKRAEAYAKQGADMQMLGRLYLGSCALNKSAFLEDDCKRYSAIADLITDQELTSYHALLTGALSSGQVASLPPQYRTFGTAYLAGDTDAIRKSVAGLSPFPSKAVAAALARDRLDDALVESIIAEASHKGYQRLVIVWMRHLAATTTKPEKARELQKRLDVLER
jgi:hypothetical protein